MTNHGLLKRCVGVIATMLLVVVIVATSRSVTKVGAVGTGYVSLSAPARVLDTRSNGGTVDSQFVGTGERPANSTLQLLVAGRATVPSDATSVVLNVTVAATRGAGYITVYPCDAGQPTASNLNYVAGQNIPNLVISKIGAGGLVCLFNSAPTQLIADVAGYFPGGDAFIPLAAPARLLDTRPGQSTIDGANSGEGLRAGGSLQVLQVTGRANVPAGVSTVVLNVTVDQPQAAGYVTVHPCDSGTPNASNLNYVAGQAVPNAVISRLSAAGTVCLFTSAATHLIADVAGYFPDTTVLVPLGAPARLLDTRPTGATIDGAFSRTGLRPSGGTIQLGIGGRANIPADASAAVLNVTVDQTQASGFITVYPTGVGQPNASNLNYVANQAVPNAVIARLGSGGSICLFSSGATHLIVDVVGYLTGPAPVAGGSCPADPVAPPPPPTTPPATPPGNPGDTKNCTDFATHAEAQAWFDTYYPYYGDVAKLDQDGDGIACESLP
jgi:Excalibur calcium-binding domain